MLPLTTIYPYLNIIFEVLNLFKFNRKQMKSWDINDILRIQVNFFRIREARRRPGGGQYFIII